MSKYRPLPNNLTLRTSNIHGLGIFATEDIPKGHDFGITHVADSRFQHNYVRTPLGGFVNHSDTPNCEWYTDADTMKLRTIKDISKDEELTGKYWLYDPAAK